LQQALQLLLDQADTLAQQISLRVQRLEKRRNRRGLMATANDRMRVCRTICEADFCNFGALN
jgi:hypothetical protein